MTKKIILIIFFINLSFCSVSYSQNYKLIRFIDNYLYYNSGNDISYILNMYGEKVDFYSAGLVDRTFLINDKTKYFNKWPIRQNKLTSSLDIRKLTNDKFEVGFNYKYYVANDRRKLSGKARCNLILLKNDDKFLIISEKGKILKKYKYPTPLIQHVKNVQSVKDGFKIIITSIEDPVRPSAFYIQSANKKLIGINIIFENSSKSKILFNPANALLIDNKGNKIKPALGLSEKQINTKEINQGGKIQGVIPFEIKFDRSPKEFRYFIDKTMKNKIKVRF